MTITLADQRKAVVRELGFRQTVYPKWTESGRMKPEEAAYQLACMQSVLDTIDACADLIRAAEFARDVIVNGSQLDHANALGKLNAALAKVTP